MNATHTPECLGCKKEKKIHMRGLCSACYHQMRRTLLQVPRGLRDSAEQKLISAGKLLPSKAGTQGVDNPFADELQDYIGAAGRATLAFADAFSSAQDKSAADKTSRTVAGGTASAERELAEAETGELTASDREALRQAIGPQAHRPAEQPPPAPQPSAPDSPKKKPRKPKP